MSLTPEQLDTAPSHGTNGKGQARMARKAARAAARAKRRRGEMTLVEHLEELRRRVLISLAAVVVGSVGGWFLYSPVLRLLVEPYRKATGKPELDLVFTGVAEPFLLRVKISAFIGLALALPVVLWQVWRFITPGLEPKERKYAIPFVLASVVLFCVGAYFAFLTFPTALRFLLGFGGAELTPLLSADRYLGFIMLMILAFGVSFEFPVVLQFLVIANVVTSRTLRRWRRWAIMGITVFSAVITPSQDPISLMFMMVPMIVFYEAVIWISRLLLKK